MKKSTVIKWAVGLYGVCTGISAWRFFQYAAKRRHPKGWEEERRQQKKSWEYDEAEPGSYLEMQQKKSLWIREQEIEHVSILSFDGLKLSGIFFPAEGKTDRVVLVVHGYQSEGLKDFSALAAFYHEQGYHVLAVDDRAHGDSEGKYLGFGCLDREDCYRWVHYLDERFSGHCSIFLHGISMGAATVLMTSSMNLPASVKGVIADCPYTSIWKEMLYLIKREKKAWFVLYPMMKLGSKISKRVAGYEFDDCSAAEEVKDTKIPIFLIHGDDDRFVPMRMSQEIYDNCASEKEIWIVPGAHHAESYHVAKEEYEKRVLRFMNLYDPHPLSTEDSEDGR